CAAGLDDTGLEKIEAADDRRQESRHAVGERLVPRSMHAENGGGILVFSDGEKSEPELGTLDRKAQKQRCGHDGNDEETHDPPRSPAPNTWPKEVDERCNSRRAAPWFEVGDESLDRLVDSDGRQGKKSPAQAQNAEPEEQRE